VNDRELLHHHRPILRYDAQDDMRAMAVESAVFEGNLLRRRDGEVVAGRADDLEVPELTLALLSTYDARDGDHLVLAPDVRRTARLLQRRPEYANRAYGRVVRDGGRTWLQYWLWLYENPKNLFGLGSHQGDWELVQVALDAAGEPIAVTCSQHKYGEPREWSRVTREGSRPVIYVAAHSHALYFAPGTHVYPTGIDDAAAGGPEVHVHVERPGPWASWEGTWGEPVAFGGGVFGSPPRSPGRQGTRWSKPAAFHRTAWWRFPARIFGWVLHTLGYLTYPRRPGLRASVAGDTVVVAVDRAASGTWRAGRHVYLTVHTEDGRHVLASRRLWEPPRQTREAIRVPGLPPRVRVRVSTYNALRQRSDVVEVVAD
jgi:hypothetical protein